MLERDMPEYTREISRTIACGPAPHVEIRTVHGSIKVRGEERADVHVLARVHFRAGTDHEAAELMRAVEDGIYGDGGRVVVRADEEERSSLMGALQHVFGRSRHLRIDLDVSAPRGCSLTLRHVNGDVDVRAIGGDARVHMVNGRFDATDIGGDLSLRHVNGRAGLRKVEGSVDVRHTNGALEVARTGGDLKLHLVNGRVDIVDAGRSVTVKGVSGAHTLTGAVRGDLSMTNAHGQIRLHLPLESRFELDAESALGSVTSDLEVRHGPAGAGVVPRVRLRSETGSIQLKRLRDEEPVGARGGPPDRDWHTWT
jgi:putative adhesin